MITKIVYLLFFSYLSAFASEETLIEGIRERYNNAVLAVHVQLDLFESQNRTILMEIEELVSQATCKIEKSRKVTRSLNMRLEEAAREALDCASNIPIRDRLALYDRVEKPIRAEFDSLFHKINLMALEDNNMEESLRKTIAEALENYNSNKKEGEKTRREALVSTETFHLGQIEALFLERKIPNTPHLTVGIQSHGFLKAFLPTLNSESALTKAIESCYTDQIANEFAQLNRGILVAILNGTSASESESNQAYNEFVVAILNNLASIIGNQPKQTYSPLEWRLMAISLIGSRNSITTI